MSSFIKKITNASAVPSGLGTHGNTCYANTAFQCLRSLHCMQSLEVLDQRIPSKADFDLDTWRLTESLLLEFSSFRASKLDWISQELLEEVAVGLGQSASNWNSEQDIMDFLDLIFDGTALTSCQIYCHFAFKSSLEACVGETAANFDWKLWFMVPESVTCFDLSQILDEAVHVPAGGACNCGKSCLHMYSPRPRVLTISIEKHHENGRLEIKEVQTVAGKQYHLMTAANYDFTSARIAEALAGNPGTPWPESRRPAPKRQPSRLEKMKRALLDFINPPAPSKPALVDQTPLTVYGSSVRMAYSPGRGAIAGGCNAHYTAYVRRGAQWYYISDGTPPRPVDTIITNRLRVLFYERI